MSEPDALSLARALAASLDAAGADYEAKPATGGSADALLVPKSDPTKAVGLLVRAVAPEDSYAQAAAALAKAAAGRSGVLTLLAAEAARPADGPALAAAAEAALKALDSAAPLDGGLRILESPPPETGLEYASLSPAPGPLSVEVVYRGPGVAFAPAPEAASHWLVLVPPAGARPLVRGVPVPLPKGDILRRFWWAVREGQGWAFRPF